METGFNDKARQFAKAVANINTEKLLLKAAKNLEDLALDLNRSQLYDYGVDAKGKKIGEYSDYTKKLKAKKGQRSDHMTLSDTFSFYKKMFVNAKQFPLLIDSKDSKTPMLEEKYSENILGLTSENTKTYREAVKLEFKKLFDLTIEKHKEILH
jgi:hypothetical protein